VTSAVLLCSERWEQDKGKLELELRTPLNLLDANPRMCIHSTSATNTIQSPATVTFAIVSLVLTYNTERPPEEFYSAKGPLIPRSTSRGPEPEKQQNIMFVMQEALITLNILLLLAFQC
jgi:hypothetical protein